MLAAADVAASRASGDAPESRKTNAPMTGRKEVRKIIYHSSDDIKQAADIIGVVLSVGRLWLVLYARG